MHRFRSYLLIAGLLVLAIVACTQLVRAAVSDYEYVVTVAIDNQGSALADTPVAVSMMNISGLVTAEMLQADAEDWFPADVSQAELQGVAQGMSTTSAPWWVDITQSAGSMSLYSFYMGYSSATRDQRFRFDGTTDTLTVTDHADLDIIDDLILEVEFEAVVWPATTGTAFLLQKDGAYEIEVSTVAGDETITATVTSAGDSASVSTTVDDASVALVAGTEYAIAVSYDKDAVINNLRLYINDAVVDQADFTDALASTANNLVIGANVNGYIDAVNVDPLLIYEYYITGADDVQSVNGAVWAAQTFTPSTTHSVQEGQLYIECVNSPGTVTVGFRGTSGGLPGSSDLTSGAFDGDTADCGDPGWFRIEMDTPVTLTASTQYAIVLRAPDGVAGNHVNWYWDGSSPSYTGGQVRVSDDSGATWAAGEGGEDFMFEEWGAYTVGSSTKVLFDFEPDELESTQVGNSGNSWVWTGTVEDVSAGGSDHDGTYSLTRDLSDVRVWLYSLESTDAPTVDPTPTPIDSLGAITLTPVATPDEIDFLFREQLVDVLEHTDIGIIPMAAWFVFLTGLGLIVSVGVWAKTKSPFLVAIPLPTAYWIGYGLGTPIPLWLPLVFTFVSIGAAYGLSKITE